MGSGCISAAKIVFLKLSFPLPLPVCFDDFFVSFINLQHIQKYGSAFLNTDGGVLIAGVLDNGKRHMSLVEEGKQ